MAAPTLRPYQRAALDAVCDAREGKEGGAGLNRLLVQKPTGTGKTVMFAAMLQWPRLASWLATFPKGERKMLVVAHREELLDQAADKIQRQNPHLRIAIEQGDRHAGGFSDVVIASIQTLAARNFTRLRRLLERHVFRLVVVDEAHHAAAPTYRTMLAHLGFLPRADISTEENIEAAKFDDVAVMEAALAGWDAEAPKDRLLVGVTATPNRTDTIGLGCVFQSIAFSYRLRQAIADGWLVPIVPWIIETDTSLDAVKMTHGDFNQRQLADTVNTDRRNQLALAGWQEHAAGRSTIAFTVDVAHAHAVAETFNVAGIRAAAVSGETPKEDRRSILRRYTAGEIQVIANCMVLTEGTDLPRTSCILHLKPTKSATLYEQMTGRGLRLFEGKSDCILLDVVDIARRHSLQTAPALYGLPPNVTPAEGKTLDQTAEWLDELLDKHPGILGDDETTRLSLADLQARAATFDIWTVPSMGEYERDVAMGWIRHGDRFTIEYPWQDGNERLTVEKNMLGKFDLVATFRQRREPNDQRPPMVRQRTLATGIENAHIALRTAESFVASERRTVAKLRDKTAAWRSKPASSGQIAYLRRLRVPFDTRAGALTMGQASDLIELAKAKRASQ